MSHLALALLLLPAVEGLVTFDGTPLPGATVILTCEDGAKRVTVSDAEGRYHFDGVEGPYTLGVEMTGFAVRKTDGTTIDMKSSIQESICRDFCEDGWDHRPFEDPAKFSAPRAMKLPVPRGIAGAMALAPGVH